MCKQLYLQVKVSALIVLTFVPVASCWAQGQDGTTTARDLQVIATLLQGGFDNANQAYFDVRGKREPKHRRLHVEVQRISADEFSVSGFWDSNQSLIALDQLWSLREDAETRTVLMSVADRQTDNRCELRWQREAAQFRAESSACPVAIPHEITLSEKQLWMSLEDAPGSGYQMHRTRSFQCYADVPGVGGGRDEPYDRYDGLEVHDQGGAAWFTTNDGRELGISLFLVDWPINNYDGVFTRDSFVIYLSEKLDGKNKEHGYAFTVPGADRIGINLKWILGSCFMKSNADQTPYM